MKSDAETLTRALDWIMVELSRHPDADRAELVETAAFRHNLGPLDQEWLLNQVRAKTSGTETPPAPASSE